MDPFAKKMILGAVAFGSAMLLMAGVISAVYYHEVYNHQCSEALLSQAISPDEQRIAEVLERGCDNESRFLAHVNLRPTHQPIRLNYISGGAHEGEIFVAEENSPSAVPTLEWIGPDQLTIRCPHCSPALVRKRNEHWGAVRIQYEIGRP